MQELPYLISPNLGVPVRFLAVPVALYLLIPVVIFETWLAQKTITQLSSSRRLGGVALANTISTFGGWPLTWVIFAALHDLANRGGGEAKGLLTPLKVIVSEGWQTASTILYKEELYWMVPTAAMILMVPAFFVTILIEGAVLHFCWSKVPFRERGRFVLFANLCSCVLVLGLIWVLYLTVSIALCLTLLAALLCVLWTVGHLPREGDLGPGPGDAAKMRENMVLDIRTNSQYCSYYITLFGVVATLVATHQKVFGVILNQEHLWPFGVSFFAASVATLFFPAGYGQKRFKALRIVWFRSVLCEQMVVIFTFYGLCNAFVALTHGQGLPPN